MKMQSGSDYQVKITDTNNPSVQQKMKDGFGNLSASIAQKMASDRKRQENLTDEYSKELAAILDSPKMHEFQLRSEAFLQTHINSENEPSKIGAENKRLREGLRKEQKKIIAELGVDLEKAKRLKRKIVETISESDAAASLKRNKNALSSDQLKKYAAFYNPKTGHFDTPSPMAGDNGVFDLAVYQAPFDGSSYRWSYSAAGSNFSVDEASRRIYDANLGITANQIAISLGVDSTTDSTYFNSENVSLLLVNHRMKAAGYVRVVVFFQCNSDTDDVKILDHSQVFTWFGNVGLGSSETTDTHALYLDLDGENLGQSIIYQQPVIPYDTDDHDYSDLDLNVPSELRNAGFGLPTRFNTGDVLPLWIGTGCTSDSHAVGQEIRTNTFQSWKIQSVWVITQSSL